MPCMRVLRHLSLWTVAHRLLCPWDSPGKNAGVGCHALLQAIFSTQGLNPCLLHLLHRQAGSLPLVPLGDASVLYFGHPNCCLVASHCFNLHFPQWNMMYLFIWLFAISIPPLLRCLLRSLSYFSLQELSSVLEAKVRNEENVGLCSPSLTHKKR